MVPRNVRLAVRSVIDLPRSPVDNPRRRARNLTFAVAQHRQRVAAAVAAKQPGHDGWVDDGFTVVDTAERVEENRDVEHALFEEIADPFRPLVDRRIA
jgi:hypothetical protein